jgi:hypothetical protein
MILRHSIYVISPNERTEILKMLSQFDARVIHEHFPDQWKGLKSNHDDSNSGYIGSITYTVYTPEALFNIGFKSCQIFNKARHKKL